MCKCADMQMRNDKMMTMWICKLQITLHLIARHEAISILYKAALPIGDCFVPRNDAWS